MRYLMQLFLAFFLIAAFGTAYAEGAATGYGAELQGFPYPYPVQHFPFKSQGTDLQMGYMDVKPTKQANGHTVVLMHGKNFCGATWETTIAALADAGYRVVVPDQIGFCTSTKPAFYQFTFQQLASNTMALLKRVGVSRAILIGHSTGGMLATRFALMYPEAVEKLVMVNPIGLEDWKAMGVPGRTVDQWYERELKLSADGVRQYEKSVYYGGGHGTFLIFSLSAGSCFKYHFIKNVPLMPPYQERPPHALLHDTFTDVREIPELVS